MSDHIPTTGTPEPPAPDEQFIDDFERQLRLGIQRRTRLDPGGLTHRKNTRKGMSMFLSISLMTLSMMFGATGTYAIIYQDPAPLRELHVQKAGILLEQAQLRLERSQADLNDYLPLIEKGYSSQLSAERYYWKVAIAEAELNQRELDVKETRVTGRAPVNDLSGPLVAGEDFVVERLEALLDATRLYLQHQQAAFDRSLKLVENNYISDREHMLARVDLEQAEQSLTNLQDSIKLRRSFTSGELTAEQVELRALLRDSEAEFQVAQGRFSITQSKLKGVTARHDRSMTTDGEFREAQGEARDAESVLRLAELQLKMIRQRLEAIEPQE